MEAKNYTSLFGIMLVDQCNVHKLGQTSRDGEGQGGLVCCSPWGCKELDMTGQLNNNATAAAAAAKSLQPCPTPWTTAHQAPPSLGFSRQEYWSGLPLPSPEQQC